MTINEVKQRFGIIGNSPLLDRVLDISLQVATTHMSVMITGESGSGKEIIPQIIHQLSSRKHGAYIAVNCGAIPEGTIDSELFGHEKGAFTGAHESRKGYFEVVNEGTIFLDEIAELPLSTQVRLLRVLESGEFMRVGSSKVIKTDVRVIAATNVNVQDAIQQNKFREDLFYRLSTVPIHVPSLRERTEDIHLLFRKFAADFADQNRMPSIALNDEAIKLLTNYNWPGNIRQLKNIAEQLSVIEKNRMVSADILSDYLPIISQNRLPVLQASGNNEPGLSEREILYKVLFDMKKDIIELKRLVVDILGSEKEFGNWQGDKDKVIKKLSEEIEPEIYSIPRLSSGERTEVIQQPFERHEVLTEETLSLQDKEVEMIKKALEKHRGKRKGAARELGISERTLYRKIKEHEISL